MIGRKTRQAIASYQQATGLEPDGKPTADLADHIRFTREVAEASLFTGTIEASPDAEQRATVRRVQTGLAELAYSPGAITGEMNARRAPPSTPSSVTATCPRRAKSAMRWWPNFPR